MHSPEPMDTPMIVSHINSLDSEKTFSSQGLIRGLEYSQINKFFPNWKAAK